MKIIKNVWTPLAFGLLGIMFLSACSDSEENEEIAGSELAKYVGVWETSCQDKGGGVYQIDSLTISNDGATLNAAETRYTNAECTAGESDNGDFDADVEYVDISSDVTDADQVQLTITGLGMINQIFLLDSSADPNTLRRGDRDSCSDDCTGTDFPTELKPDLETLFLQ